jgi:hypothetical protein
MKITKYIPIETCVEVDINISGEEIIASLAGSDDTPRAVLESLNTIASFFNNLPDEMIEELKPQQKKIVREFLEKQSSRFGVTPTPIPIPIPIQTPIPVFPEVVPPLTQTLSPEERTIQLRHNSQVARNETTYAEIAIKEALRAEEYLKELENLRGLDSKQ